MLSTAIDLAADQLPREARVATFARSPLFIVLLLGCVVGLWLLDRARRGERGVTPQDWV